MTEKNETELNGRNQKPGMAKRSAAKVDESRRKQPEEPSLDSSLHSSTDPMDDIVEEAAVNGFGQSIPSVTGFKDLDPHGTLVLITIPMKVVSEHTLSGTMMTVPLIPPLLSCITRESKA